MHFFLYQGDIAHNTWKTIHFSSFWSTLKTEKIFISRKLQKCQISLCDDLKKCIFNYFALKKSAVDYIFFQKKWVQKQRHFLGFFEQNFVKYEDISLKFCGFLNTSHGNFVWKNQIPTAKIVDFFIFLLRIPLEIFIINSTKRVALLVLLRGYARAKYKIHNFSSRDLIF